MMIITESLNDKTTTAVAHDVLTAIIERGMESEMKMDIIDFLQIPPRVRGLICSADDSILYSAAQLIEKVDPYYHISLNLLMNKDNNISGCVAPFIQQYMRDNPEVSLNVLKISYTRLKDYYSNQLSVDFSLNELPKDASYCEMLFSIYLINHLSESFISCFNKINDWTIINDNTVEIIDMIDNYLSLLLTIISNVESDILQKIFDLVLNILNSESKYFCYQLVMKIYSFIYHSKYFQDET